MTSILRSTILLSWCCVSLVAFASDNQRDIERNVQQTYIGHLLSLKSPSVADHLHFKPDGQLAGSLIPGPWTTSGIFQVIKVAIKANHLELEGDRVVIGWRVDQTPTLLPVVTGRKVRVTLESDVPIADVGQVTQMLVRVFDKGNIDNRIANYWKPNPAAIEFFGKPVKSRAPEEVLGVLEGDRIVRGSSYGAVNPPRPLYDPDPEYTNEGKSKRVEGTTILRMVVNENGLPEIIEIAKSLGGGLDVRALEAVSTWRFAPATMKGKPVPVMISVEMSFRLGV